MPSSRLHAKRSRNHSRSAAVKPGAALPSPVPSPVSPAARRDRSQERSRLDSRRQGTRRAPALPDVERAASWGCARRAAARARWHTIVQHTGAVNTCRRTQREPPPRNTRATRARGDAGDWGRRAALPPVAAAAGQARIFCARTARAGLLCADLARPRPCPQKTTRRMPGTFRFQRSLARSRRARQMTTTFLGMRDFINGTDDETFGSSDPKGFDRSQIVSLFAFGKAKRRGFIKAWRDVSHDSRRSSNW